MEWRCEHCDKKQLDIEGRGTRIVRVCDRCGATIVLDTTR